MSNPDYYLCDICSTYDGSLLKKTEWSGPVSGTVEQTYDNNFRVITQKVNGNSTSYQYDRDGLLIQAGALGLTRDPRNGLLTGTTLGSVTTAQTYDSFGEVTHLEAQVSTTPAFAIDYTRDKLGRITRKVETIQGVTDTYDYTYDLAGRLTEVRKNGVRFSLYTYDANSNRTAHETPSGTIAATYDAQDRLLTYGDATYAHNANGDLASKTRNGQTVTYDYDELGNLRKVTLADGIQIEYLVDGQSRRVGKKIDGVLVQGFLYEDWLSPAAELDSTGQVVARFVYATRSNVPDYLVKGGITYRILADHLGSPRLVVELATGAIVQRMDYDEFGRVVLDTNPGFQPFGFAGGLYDRQTGLVRFGVRDYDSQAGRWTVKDPIGFEGRSANIYSYVSSDPINWFDPLGLWGVDIGDFSFGNGDPTLVFDDSSWDVFEDAAAATADGFIPFFDPFENFYDPCDPALNLSKELGGISRDLLLAAAGAASGPKGALFGRAKYRAGKGSGIFNRGRGLRVGWSWKGSSGRNWFSVHGGKPGTPGHWHVDLLPGPKGPLW